MERCSFSMTFILVYPMAAMALSGLFDFLLCSLFFLSVSAKADHDLIEWISSFDGADFNQKQEIRWVDDEETANGVFALENIKEGEVLLQVPWSAIISTDDAEDTDGDEDEDEVTLRCGLVRKLAQEIRLGDDSSYAQFVNYLSSQPQVKVPSFWSNEGKVLLLDILGGWGAQQEIPPLQPIAWLDEWLDGCEGDPEDEIGTYSAMLLVQLGNGATITPVYDFYNHRNGHSRNSFMVNEPGIQQTVYASRDISKGEQIYKSYSFCPECGEEEEFESYGTPEIFRDYGIVESYPQTWILGEGEAAFELDEGENGLEVEWLFEVPSSEEHRYALRRRLEKRVMHLYKVRNLAYDLKPQDSNIPDHEWTLIFEYHQAITDALSYAYNSLEKDKQQWLPVSSEEQVCTIDDPISPMCGNHYDELEEEQDDLDYKSPTCGKWWEWMYFEGYQSMENLTTSYQNALFHRHPDTGDVCMDIDNIVQICSSYRPQYHEFSANFPGRFIQEVKRVLFVGGGDSMLLHEALKYPTIEKVVGLELDQVITRKSFKYFHTQPHFDDERVEWWFGDATKTLLLLPKDYWASFDLVLVDLSETVMSFPVTGELDIFDALALLLKPEGIMVKNELYIDEMSSVFDYTIQIRYDSPKICGQIMALGSNRVDFFHDLPIDHNIHNNLLPPLEEISYRYELMHDYRKNDAWLQGKCENVQSNKTADLTQQERSAGVFHVIDIENVQDPEALEKSLSRAIQDAGLTPVSSQTGNADNVSVVVLKEGYIIARGWPDQNYISLGINLWGSFHKEQVVLTSLKEIFGTSSLSSFRVVVGGMYGSTTWRDDQLRIGPQIVQNRNCETPSISHSSYGSETSEVVSQLVIGEFVNLFQADNLVVGLLCGFEDGRCGARKKILEENSAVGKVVTFWTCPELRDIVEREDEDFWDFPVLFKCEKAMIEELRQEMSAENSFFDLFIVDASAPFEMAQIFNSIWSMPKYRSWYIREERSLFLGISTNLEDAFQRSLLDRYRKDLRYDPTARAEFLVRYGSKKMEVGVVSAGDSFVFQSLATVEQNLKVRIRDSGLTEVTFELQKINGAQWNYQDDLAPREFLQEDYDGEPAKAQFMSQKSLGREIIFQLLLNAEKDGATMPSMADLVISLEKALSKLDMKESKSTTYTDVGDGAVAVFTFEQGSAVLTWDGREHIDINLFNVDDREELADSFIASFVNLCESNVTLALRDDYPRGTGRVINFNKDTLEQEDKVSQ